MRSGSGPKYDEEVCIWTKLRALEPMTERKVRAFCEGKIALFKIPRYIRFVDAYPMTVTGKVRKYVMWKQMVDELERADAQRA